MVPNYSNLIIIYDDPSSRSITYDNEKKSVKLFAHHVQNNVFAFRVKLLLIKFSDIVNHCCVV